MTRTVLMAGILFSWCAADCQNSPARPEFEVASVKPAKPPVDGRLMIGMSNDPGRINMTNVSLRELISSAYDVKQYQVSGPEWINSTRFDVTATVAAGTPKETIRLMSQNLLADRFHLAVHRDQKLTPLYALVNGKSGFRLKPSEGSGKGMSRMMPGRLDAQKMTLAGFSDMLSRMLDRPVVDQTKLEGSYDFTLEWTPDESQMQQMKLAFRDAGPGPGGAGHSVPASTDIEGPSIFAAVEEKLGLKLEARSLPMDVLVVDHADQVPEQN